MCQITTIKYGFMVDKYCEITDEERELIKQYNQLALDNYEVGGHWFVECYGETEWIQFIRSGGTVEKLRKEWELQESVAEDIRRS